MKDETPAGGAKSALVFGGKGGMGSWFCEFLAGKGYDVAVSDPRGAPPGYDLLPEVRGREDDFDLLVVATPMRIAPELLEGLRLGRPRGLVFDVCSLKSPVAEALRAMAKDGLRVTSVHPMWGPKADILAGRNVLVVDCGVPDANRAARALFEDTAASIVDLPLADHDTLMAYTLTLPHALNIVFGRAMAQSGIPLARLLHLGGPTFAKQVEVAGEIAGENRELYFDIQALNSVTPDVHEAMRKAMKDLADAVQDRERFVALMETIEKHFGSAAEGER